MKSASILPSCVQIGLQVCAPRVWSRIPRSTTMKLVAATAAANPDRMLRRLIQTGCNQHQLHQHHPRELDCSQFDFAIKCPLILRSVTDRYKGVHVSLAQLSANCSLSYFESLLNGLWLSHSYQSTVVIILVLNEAYLHRRRCADLSYHSYRRSS